MADLDQRRATATLVSTGSDFAVGEATRLFESPDLTQNGVRFAVVPDGQRFITIQVNLAGGNVVPIVENWNSHFRARNKDQRSQASAWRVTS